MAPLPISAAGSKASLASFYGLTSPMEQIFNAAKIAIVAVDLKGNIIFANPTARKLIGLGDRQSLPHTWDIIKDIRDRKIAAEEFERRARGESSDYEVTFRRIDNGRRITVRIAAVTLEGENRTPAGSLAIIQDVTVAHATKRIIKAVQEEEDWESLIKRLAREIRSIVPFDELSLALVETRGRLSHGPIARALFRCSKAIKNVGIERSWYALTSKSAKRLCSGPIYVNGLPAFFREIDMGHLLDDPNGAVARGIRSMLIVPAIRQGRLRASLTLASKQPMLYDDRDLTIIRSLPINEALDAVLEYHALNEVRFANRITRGIWNTTSNAQMGGLIVDELAQHYNWKSVSIFVVNHRSGELLLKSQNARGAAPNDTRRKIGVGALGQAVQREQPVCYPDLRMDSGSGESALPLHAWAQSLLCYPVRFNRRIRWVLNIEDPRRYAFEAGELEGLERLFDMAAGALMAQFERHVMRAVVQGSSQGIVIADEEGTVMEMNDEARRILKIDPKPRGTSIKNDKGQRGISFEGLVEDKGIGRVLAETKVDTYEERILLRRSDNTPVQVLLSARYLKDAFGRRVFFLKDLEPLRELKEREGAEAAFLELSEQVRAPLSLATSFIGRLADKLLDADGNDYMDRARRQLSKLQTSFDRLAMWRADLGNEFSNIDLNRLVESVLQDLPRKEREKISAQQPSHVIIRGDWFQLRNIMQSLLSNLIRFCAENAKIDLRTSMQDGRGLLEIRGQVPRGFQKHMQSEGHLSALALGEPVIKRVVEEIHGGTYGRVIADGGAVYSIALPASESSG